MSHITRQTAIELAAQHGINAEESQLFGAGDLELLCNAAIQHYIDSAALAQPEPVEPADTRVHLAGPDTPVYYVLHADGIYSEANPQPAQPATDMGNPMAQPELENCKKVYSELVKSASNLQARVFELEAQLERVAQPEPVSPLEKRNLEGLGMSSTYFRGLGWNEAIDALAAAKGGAL